MPLLQEVTEKGTSFLPVDRVRYGHEARKFDMPCGISPEGIAGKAFPAGSSAPPAMFYAAVG